MPVQTNNNAVRILFLFYPFQVIFREDSDSWVNVSNILYFFNNSPSNVVEFIVSSEETGWRHLYLVQANFVPQIPESEEEAFRRVRLQPQILKKVPLTSGEWLVHFTEFDPILIVKFEFLRSIFNF